MYVCDTVAALLDKVVPSPKFHVLFNKFENAGKAVRFVKFTVWLVLVWQKVVIGVVNFARKESTKMVSVTFNVNGQPSGLVNTILGKYLPAKL